MSSAIARVAIVPDSSSNASAIGGITSMTTGTTTDVSNDYIRNGVTSPMNAMASPSPTANLNGTLNVLSPLTPNSEALGTSMAMMGLGYGSGSGVGNGCSKCGNKILNGQCMCRNENPVIVIEPGRHFKQLVDTRGGTVRIVGSPHGGNGQLYDNGEDFRENNDFDIKTTLNNTKKKARLKLKMNAAKRNGSVTSLVESVKEEYQDRSLHTANENDSTIYQEEEESKYVFVPVGNGLYRKQLKASITSGSSLSRASTHSHTPLSSVSSLDSLGAPQASVGSCRHFKPEQCCGPEVHPDECLDILTKKLEPSQTSSCCSGTSAVSSSSKASCSNGSGSNAPRSSNPNIGANHHTDPPLIIAPMSFDGASFSDMGFTDLSVQSSKADFDNIKPENDQPSLANDGDEELNSLQRILDMEDAEDGESLEFYDVYYTASCVIPGQCECGDSCACAGCPTHDPNYH